MHASHQGLHAQVHVDVSQSADAWTEAEPTLSGHAIILGLCVQEFDGGSHLAHSGMNASAIYLFDRIYSLAQVCSACCMPCSSVT